VLLKQGNYLLTLIREYLDLARIEGGDLKLKVQRGIDIVSEVIEPALGIVQAEFQGTMIRWTKEAPEKGVKCDCDPELMRIVTVNLLNNAAKYGNQDGTIRAKVTQHEDRVIVAVRNEGLGFRQSDRQRLFKKFSRLAAHEFAGIKGTGVGLYISWRIINLHNGHIGAESEYGKWAEFAYEIPIRHVADTGSTQSR
jgi:signal transduction histidine kinase